MGVTSIQSYFHDSNYFLTGSYNEKGFFFSSLLFTLTNFEVYLWDHRKLQYPFAEERVGGGVWRIKAHPRRSDFILLAAMHGGFRVLRLDVAAGNGKV